MHTVSAVWISCLSCGGIVSDVGQSIFYPLSGTSVPGVLMAGVCYCRYEPYGTYILYSTCTVSPLSTRNHPLNAHRIARTLLWLVRASSRLPLWRGSFDLFSAFPSYETDSKDRKIKQHKRRHDTGKKICSFLGAEELALPCFVIYRLM